MITPKEIENKEFTKALRGYNADEVDEFLDIIIEDLEDLIAERDRLKSENQILRSENDKHKESEKSVMNTLDTAKKLMKDISESAEKRADIIIRNARLDAQMILKDARDSASDYSNESKDLRDKIIGFRARYRRMLEDEIERIDEKGVDILADLERDFMPASIMEELPDVRPLEEEVDLTKTAAFTPIEEEHAAEEILAEIAKEANQSGIEQTKVVSVTAFNDAVKRADAEEYGTVLGSAPSAPRETVAISSDEISALLKENK